MSNNPLTAPMPEALQQYLQQLNTVIKPYFLAQGMIATPINVREALALLTYTYVTQSPEMAKIIDCYTITPNLFHGYRVPLRIFIPKNLPLPNIETPVAVPVMIYFHGGGGMAGSVSVYDKIYKKFAEASHCIVIAPEYRLAPENPYPASIDDAHTVLKFLTPTLESIGYICQNCTIVGDSAGGAMTATLVQDWLANRINTDITINKQILIYAGLDYTLSQPSIQENAEGYLLESSRVQWYYDNYFHRHDDRELVSPFWTDLQMLTYHTPHTLPKTLNITAGYCPLRDEDIIYHQQLLDAGFPSKWLHFPEMIHAFLNLEDLCSQSCQKLYNKVAEFCQSS